MDQPVLPPRAPRPPIQSSLLDKTKAQQMVTGAELKLLSEDCATVRAKYMKATFFLQTLHGLCSEIMGTEIAGVNMKLARHDFLECGHALNRMHTTANYRDSYSSWDSLCLHLKINPETSHLLMKMTRFLENQIDDLDEIDDEKYQEMTQEYVDQEANSPRNLARIRESRDDQLYETPSETARRKVAKAKPVAKKGKPKGHQRSEAITAIMKVLGEDTTESKAFETDVMAEGVTIGTFEKTRAALTRDGVIKKTKKGYGKGFPVYWSKKRKNA